MVSSRFCDNAETIGKYRISYPRQSSIICSNIYFYTSDIWLYSITQL